MKYGIIGTGAVGGYYGGLLAKQGYDVHFLLHSDYAHVVQKGLKIESIYGDFSISNVNAYAKPEEMPKCDVVIIALKSTQNHLLHNILPLVTQPDGTVIVLQNGLGLEADIQAIVPHATVIGGLCFLCSNKIGPGHIKHIDFGKIRLGEYHPDGPAGITDNLRKIAQIFEKAGIPVALSVNLEKARWEKLVWNMSYNGLSAILNATTDQIMLCPSTLTLVREIMLEVIRTACACGYDLSENLADEMLETTRSMAKYSPSMKLDSENKRALEIEKIYWKPIQTAHKAGIDMHYSRVIALQLEFIDQKNRL
jgi:2-dehydropantoate 2-reductase